MTKTMLFSLGGLTLLLALVLACGTIGLGVRQGAIPEILIRFPPNTRFQLILRIGADTMPWQQGRARETAINLWAHQQGTSWHIVNIIHLGLGETADES
jgi:hypothetical protein